MFLSGDETIKEAIGNVKVNYIDEYGEEDTAYLNAVYKNSSGWHVED